MYRNYSVNHIKNVQGHRPKIDIYLSFPSNRLWLIRVKLKAHSTEMFSWKNPKNNLIGARKCSLDLTVKLFPELHKRKKKYDDYNPVYCMV